MKYSKKNAVKAIIIAILVVLFLFVFIFMTVECHLRLLGVKQAQLSYAYGDAFSSVENISKANPRITELAMLGSHDAVSYGIEFKNKLDGEAKSGLFGKTERLAKGLMYRFAVTQTVDLYSQLMQGARYFHIKVSMENGVWHGSHSMLAKPLADDMTDILKFLSEHTGEFVILNFQTMYCEGQPYETLYDFLATVRYGGTSIFDFVAVENGIIPPIKTLTYNDVTANGSNCGAILTNAVEDKSGAEYKSEFSKYFYSGGFMGRWYNSSSQDKLIGGMNDFAEYIEKFEDSKDYIRINQAQAAFSVKDFDDTVKTLFGQSLLKIAKKNNVDFLNHPSFDRWLRAMPVYQADFITSAYGDFNNRINAKIREFNNNMCKYLIKKAP